MWSTIKKLLASKKALVAIITVIAFVAGRFGLELDVDELAAALAPFYLYLLAQGAADFKKEAAKELRAAAESKPVEASEPDPT